jgi:hypothetical protein
MDLEQKYLEIMAADEAKESKKIKAEKRPKSRSDEEEEEKRVEEATDELGVACFSTEPKRTRRGRNPLSKRSNRGEDLCNSVRKKIPLKESRTDSISPIVEVSQFLIFIHQMVFIK